MCIPSFLYQSPHYYLSLSVDFHLENERQGKFMNNKHRATNMESGFSIIELLVVVSVIAILSTVALFYASAHQRLYLPDEQALLITDILQEARQRSLTQRETLRIEINATTNTVSLYNENTATTASDDVLIRKLALASTTKVKVGAPPSEIGYNPAEPLPVPNPVYATSVYPTSISQSVCTLRFSANGTVRNAGTNATGGGSVVTGLTLHIWMPNKVTPTQSDIARSITVIGSTGTIRMWEFAKDSTASNKWKDSRRSGSY